MVSLAGLSAAPGGFMEARTADNANKLSEQKLQDLALDRAGEQAFGKTLQAFGVQMPGQGGMPPGGQQMAPGQPQNQSPMAGNTENPARFQPPQQMAPGQPSMPMQHLGMQPQSFGAPPSGAMPGAQSMGGPSSGQMPQYQNIQQPGPSPVGQPPQQQGGFAPQQPGTGPLSWQTIAQKISQANPGAPPEVIARAVNRAIPLMNAQSQQEWRQMRTELDFMKEQGRGERQAAGLDSKETIAEGRNATQRDTTEMREGGKDRRTGQSLDSRERIAGDRNDAQRYGVDSRAETQRNAEDGRNSRADLSASTKKELGQLSDKTRRDQFDAAESGRNNRSQQSLDTRKGIASDSEQGRNDRFQQRETRLEANATVRQDQGYQRLEQQAAAQAERVRSSQGREGLAEWRATVDAAHKRAMEVIQASRDMPAADRKALVKQQEQFYNQQLEDMRKGVGRSTPGAAGAAPGEPAPAKGTPKAQERAPTSTPGAGAAGAIPPEALAQLKPGHVTTFGNGQKWTIENGQPKQLP